MALGAITAGFAIMGAATGGSTGGGILIGHAVDSTICQLELQNRLQATMFIGVSLIKAMPIIVIIIGFFVMNK